MIGRPNSHRGTVRSARPVLRSSTIVGLLALPLAACGEGEFIPDGPLAERPVEAAEIVQASAIVEQADVPTVDPSRLEDVDIAKAFGGPASCVFRYTPDGAPVVAFSDRTDGAAALVKVNGDLVVLDVPQSETDVGLEAGTGPVRLALAPGGENRWGVPETLAEADLRFAIGDELDVGYGGYTDCPM